MSAPIKVKHNDIEITYDEDTDKWVFTLRGQERSCKSLNAAKALINKPAPRNSKPFKRTKCYWKDYQDDWMECEATSIVPSSYGGYDEAWITAKDKTRSKVMARELFPQTNDNTELFRRWNFLQKQIGALVKEQESVIKKMKSLDVEAEKEEA